MNGWDLQFIEQQPSSTTSSSINNIIFIWTTSSSIFIGSSFSSSITTIILFSSKQQHHIEPLKNSCAAASIQVKWPLLCAWSYSCRPLYFPESHSIFQHYSVIPFLFKQAVLWPHITLVHAAIHRFFIKQVAA